MTLHGECHRLSAAVCASSDCRIDQSLPAARLHAGRHSFCCTGCVRLPRSVSRSGKQSVPCAEILKMRLLPCQALSKVPTITPEKLGTGLRHHLCSAVCSLSRPIRRGRKPFPTNPRRHRQPTCTEPEAVDDPYLRCPSRTPLAHAGALGGYPIDPARLTCLGAWARLW